MFDRIRIVLVNTSHPGNIGASARAMKNMGLSRLHLVSPKHHPTEEAYSRAVGAYDLLGDAVITDSLAEALKGCVWVAGTSARDRSIQWPMLDAESCADHAQEQVASGDIAIVFGREDSGLTNEELELCNALIRIPCNPEFSSLNLSQAVQVVCYELRKAFTDDSFGDVVRDEIDERASMDELDSMYQHFLDTMTETGFIDKNEPEKLMRRIKGLFNRAMLSKREVKILRGILSSSVGRKSARRKE